MTKKQLKKKIRKLEKLLEWHQERYRKSWADRGFTSLVPPATPMRNKMPRRIDVDKAGPVQVGDSNFPTMDYLPEDDEEC